jgi:G protein-coupled receptor 139
MHEVSSAVLVASLAVTDIIALTGFMLVMAPRTYTPSIISRYSCASFQFILSFGSLFSAWIVVSITIERTVIVCMPLKSHTLTSRRKMGIVVLILFIYCLLHNIHFFWVSTSVGAYCTYKETEYKSFLEIFSVYDSVMAFILPTVIVFILNIEIIVVMRRQSNSLNMMNNSFSHDRENQSRQMTGMLLAVSICFFICMLPISVMQVLLFGFLDVKEATLPVFIRINLSYKILQMMWMLNHSINIVLYCLTGHKFRSTLLQIFNCKKPVQVKQSKITSVSGMIAINKTV